MERERPYAKDRTDYVVNLIKPSKKDKVLTIGIANIPEVEMKIENVVKECWVIDMDERKMAEASRFLGKTKILLGDVIESKELKKGYFDKIIMLEVLEHLDNDEAVLNFVNSLLKKGGTLILSVPNNAFLHIINPVRYLEHKRHYSNKRLKRILVENGFRIEHFNVVENWKLLANLYVHLFFKYIWQKTVKFGVFNKKGDKTYRQLNKRGLDLIVKARKV